VAAAIAADKGVSRPAAGNATDAAKAIASRCWAANARPCCWATPPRTMPQASSLLALANWIGQQTGATVGYLTKPPTPWARSWWARSLAMAA
jgi:NADH-quinone oxidoreductase subunit G